MSQWPSVVARAGVLVLVSLLCRSASASDAADLGQRLGAFRSPGPFAATLALELRTERTAHGHSVKAEASVRVAIEESAAGLRTTWDPALLRQADAEEEARDHSSEKATPVREAIKQLDPPRIAHLLDQTETLAGLTRGTPVEEGREVRDGVEARRLVYRFQPRPSWTEAPSLQRSDGRFTVWVAADGTPLASESVATLEGKTSRVFGRFKTTTIVRTRYAAAGGRLSVAEREMEDTRSREDGSEIEHTWQKFVVEPR